MSILVQVLCIRNIVILCFCVFVFNFVYVKVCFDFDFFFCTDGFAYWLWSSFCDSFVVNKYLYAKQAIPMAVVLQGVSGVSPVLSIPSNLHQKWNKCITVSMKREKKPPSKVLYSRGEKSLHQTL
uniref:Uncharacterized protein n=1 Tax=Cacopsylla melanoneura TaxID=428564 RepID=A0A8D8Q4S1_9HEMI